MAATTAVLSLNWLVVNFCYYGLSLHSANLSGDIFLNFVLSAAVEIPAVLLGMYGKDPSLVRISIISLFFFPFFFLTSLLFVFPLPFFLSNLNLIYFQGWIGWAGCPC